MVKRPEEYPLSSYRSFVYNSSDGLVKKKLILSMLAQQERKAKTIYKRFVESTIDVPVENPFDKVYAGMILGSEGFIRKTLERISDACLRNEDISHRNELKSIWTVEDILEIISKHFNVSRQDILQGRSKEFRDHRKIAIYFLKRYSSSTNREIGQVFGNLSSSAARKIFQRFSKQLLKDEQLKKKIAKTDRELSHVRG